MTENKGLNKKETIETLVNSLVFAIPAFLFYLEGNKILSAFSAMASLFNLYIITLSKSGKKTAIIGASVFNIIVTTFILMHYFSISNWFYSSIWLVIGVWYINSIIKKIR